MKTQHKRSLDAFLEASDEHEIISQAVAEQLAGKEIHELLDVGCGDATKTSRILEILGVSPEVDIIEPDHTFRKEALRKLDIRNEYASTFEETSLQHYDTALFIHSLYSFQASEHIPSLQQLSTITDTAIIVHTALIGDLERIKCHAPYPYVTQRHIDNSLGRTGMRWSKRYVQFKAQYTDQADLSFLFPNHELHPSVSKATNLLLEEQNGALNCVDVIYRGEVL